MLGRDKTIIKDNKDNIRGSSNNCILKVNENEKIQVSESTFIEKSGDNEQIKIEAKREAEYSSNSHSNGSSSNGHSSHSSNNSRDKYRKRHRRCSFASKLSTPRGSNASSGLSYFSTEERDYSAFTRRATTDIIYIIKNKAEHQPLRPLQEGRQAGASRKKLLLNYTADFLEENLQDVVRIAPLIEALNHKPTKDTEEEIDIIADERSAVISELLKIINENIINTELFQDAENEHEPPRENHVLKLDNLTRQKASKTKEQFSDSKEDQEDLREWFKDIMLFHLSQITVFLLGSAKLTSKDTKGKEISKAVSGVGIANMIIPGASAINQIVGAGLTTFFTKKAESKTHKAINNLNFPNADEIGKFSEILSEIFLVCFPKEKLLSLRDEQSTAKMCSFFSSVSSAFFNFASHNSFADVFEQEKEPFALLLNPINPSEKAFDIKAYKNRKEIVYSYAFIKYIQNILSEKRRIELFAKEHEKQLYKALAEKLQISSSDIKLTKENIESILVKLENIKTADETVKATKEQIEKCYHSLDHYLEKQESLDRYQDEGIKRLSITVNECKRVVAEISQDQGKNNLAVSRLTTVQEESSRKLDSTNLRVERLDKKLLGIGLNIGHIEQNNKSQFEKVSQEFEGVNTQLAEVKCVLSSVGSQLEKVTAALLASTQTSRMAAQ